MKNPSDGALEIGLEFTEGLDNALWRWYVGDARGKWYQTRTAAHTALDRVMKHDPPTVPWTWGPQRQAEV